MSNSNFTKKAIQDAFLELLNEKPLGKITVKDISEKCGVNRNTFYYHYQDICMLLEEMCENDFDHIVEMYPDFVNKE
ncbi:MAG: TetR/AcrR family transcriptional regulator, partial [Mogibacterium sp.]|nr:TetR/AcrR family transcriptional regulator [Mogibacterium sp.]